MTNSFALQLTVLSEMHQQLAYLKAAKQQHTMLELPGGKSAQLLFCQSAAIACTSAAASSVQPPYVCSFQLLHDIMHTTATHQVLMHASSLMQVSPALSPPPPPPGTVAVNVTGGTNGSSPIVTVNATAGPASSGVSPIVEQSPPLASPLAPTGSPLSHCQLT